MLDKSYVDFSYKSNNPHVTSYDATFHTTQYGYYAKYFIVQIMYSII